MNVLINGLAAVGGAVTAYTAYSIYDFASLHFIKPSRPLQSYLRVGSEPTYALITGASGGIGFGVAKELVKHGFGVILLGHLDDELEEAKKSIQRETPGAAVLRIVMDARTATPDDLSEVVKLLEKHNITILMNNVAGLPFAHPQYRELGDLEPAEIDAIIDLNARFMAHLTALMVPVMRRKPKNPGERSLVLNMSSGGYIGLPWLAMYAATKAFNLALSRSLSRELEWVQNDVDCLAILPGEVLSQGNIHGVAEDAPTSDVYGRLIVNTVEGAIKRKKSDLVPYWKHDLESKIMPWLSEGTVTREITNIIRIKKQATREYYRKMR
ncbi:hypothetical protein ACHAPT_011898 [Fusarium lateritium]